MWTVENCRILFLEEDRFAGTFAVFSRKKIAAVQQSDSLPPTNTETVEKEAVLATPTTPHPSSTADRPSYPPFFVFSIV